MNLLNSLLDAIVRLEGDALVMHVGEKPYVVTTTSSVSVNRRPLAWGQVELSSRVLTPDAVLGMLTQILPPEERQALEHVGAIEYHVPAQEGALERFRIIAARGGDDIWLELRRHRPEPEAPAAEPQPEVLEPAAAAPLAVEAPNPHALSAQPPGETAPIEIPAETASAPTAPFEIVHEVNQAALTDEDVDALIEESARALPTARAMAPSDSAVHAIDHTPPPTSVEIPYAVEPETIELAEIELTLDETERETVEIAATEPQPIDETSVAAPEPAAPVAEAPSLPEPPPVVEAAVPVAEHAIGIAVPEMMPAEAEAPRAAMNVVAQESIPGPRAGCGRRFLCYHGAAARCCARADCAGCGSSNHTPCGT